MTSPKTRFFFNQLLKNTVQEDTWILKVDFQYSQYIFKHMDIPRWTEEGFYFASVLKSSKERPED